MFPLKEALKGVTAQEAAWKADPQDPHQRSIWQIVLHMTAWTENIVQRMAQRQRGDRPVGPPEGHWPALPAVLDEVAWEEAERRLWESLAALRAHIETTSLDAMLDYGNAGYSHLADLLCRLIHNAYHIGQITKLRDWHAAQSAMQTPSS